jgi:hypothetical protein
MLQRFCDLISGLQQVAGKILGRKELAAYFLISALVVVLGDSMGRREIFSKG